MQQFAWLKWRVVMVTTTITTTTTTPALREASSCLPWKCDVTIHPSDVTIRSIVTSYFAPLWCHTSPRCDVKIWPAVTSHSPSVTSYFALCDVTLRPAVTLHFFYSIPRGRERGRHPKKPLNWSQLKEERSQVLERKNIQYGPTMSSLSPPIQLT